MVTSRSSFFKNLFLAYTLFFASSDPAILFMRPAMMLACDSSNFCWNFWKLVSLEVTLLQCFSSTVKESAPLPATISFSHSKWVERMSGPNLLIMLAKPIFRAQYLICAGGEACRRHSNSFASLAIALGTSACWGCKWVYPSRLKACSLPICLT